jgi:hypothetical protein
MLCRSLPSIVYVIVIATSLAWYRPGEQSGFVSIRAKPHEDLAGWAPVCQLLRRNEACLEADVLRNRGSLSPSGVSERFRGIRPDALDKSRVGAHKFVDTWRAKVSLKTGVLRIGGLLGATVRIQGIRDGGPHRRSAQGQRFEVTTCRAARPGPPLRDKWCHTLFTADVCGNSTAAEHSQIASH